MLRGDPPGAGAQLRDGHAGRVVDEERRFTQFTTRGHEPMKVVIVEHVSAESL